MVSLRMVQKNNLMRLETADCDEKIVGCTHWKLRKYLGKMADRKSVLISRLHE